MNRLKSILTVALLAATFACNAQTYDKPLPKCVVEAEADDEFQNDNSDLAVLKSGGEIGIFMSFKFGKFHGKPYGKFLMEQGITQEEFYRHYVSKMQMQFVKGANKKLSETKGDQPALNLQFVENKVVRYMLKIEYENFDKDGEHKAYYMLIDTETGKVINQRHMSESEDDNSTFKAGRSYAKKIKSTLFNPK